jgi:hypothetical protein
MKINEVQQPSAQAIFEYLSQDKNHAFSESTLMEIAENVAHAKFTVYESVEDFIKVLEKW